MNGKCTDVVNDYGCGKQLLARYLWRVGDTVVAVFKRKKEKTTQALAAENLF